LYRENWQGGVSQPFDHVIPGAADRDKPFPYAVYGLMMGGVYLDAASVELVKEITPAKAAVKDIVKLIASDPSVDFCGVDMLCDVAAKMDVDELKPFADTEHGLFLCRKPGKDVKLQDIQFRIDAVGAVVRLAEKGGRDVTTAREKQVGGGVRLAGIQTDEKGNVQFHQGVFIVLGVLGAAGDQYGGIGHDGVPSFGGVTLFYAGAMTWCPVHAHP